MQRKESFFPDRSATFTDANPNATGSSFTTTKWATWSTSVNWVDVQVGDFNGDGFADITGRALETGKW
jgi:hypothetical protein